MTRPKDVILHDLARERARVAQLDRAHDEARAKIESLRLELDAASRDTTPAPLLPIASTHGTPQTPTQKVKLFQSLFRGRTDVFPTRFISRKTGKAGYAPACANKFKPGICGLRTGGKCGDCSNQAFFPVEDRMILDHLRGRHVMGVYPLLEAVAAEARRTGQVVGVRVVDTDDEYAAAPWTRMPGGKIPITPNVGTVPATVRAVLAQRLFIEKADVSPTLINQLKRLAAFQNPEFYKKQQMRLSTAATPRVIACAEEFPQHIALPRGGSSRAEEILGAYGVTLELDDQRQDGEPLESEFTGELTVTQERAARAILAHDIGVFVGPPGIGKTVLGTYLIAQRARSTLI